MKSGMLWLFIGMAVLFWPSGGARPTPDPQPEPDDTIVDPQPEPDEPEADDTDDSVGPVAPDCLTLSYQRDRELRLAMLRTMATTEFASDEQQANWHLEQSREVVNSAFLPYIDALGDAIYDDKLPELIEQLEAAR